MTTPIKYDATHFGVRISISETHLVHLRYHPDTELGIKQAASIDRIILAQVGTEKFTLISDFTDSYASLTKDAQRFFAKDAPSIPQISANAIIVNNLPIRILVKFFMNFFKPVYPSKIFATVDLAKKWLTALEYASNHENKKVG